MNRLLVKKINLRIFFSILLIAATLNINAQEQYHTTADLNLRSGPGSKYRSLDIVKSGERISIVEKTASLWYKVSYNGEVGFLSSKFLILEQQEKPQETELKREEPQSSFPGFAIFIAFIFLIVIFFSILFGKKNSTVINKSKPAPLINKKPIAIQTNSNTIREDDSVTEVNGNSYNLKIDQPTLSKYGSGVPFWNHQYVYSATEIKSASESQIKFYQFFKYQFKKGVYLDLEGNTNYAFILLFDIIDEYDEHKNLLLVQGQIEDIGKFYPRTKPYGLSSLLKKLEIKKDLDAIEKLKTELQRINSSNNYIGAYWGLGTKNQSRLNLNDEETKILNGIIDSGNVFNSIDLCSEQIITLFLSARSELIDHCKKLETTLEKESAIIADIELTVRYKLTKNSANYKFQVTHYVSTLYQVLYKLCENNLRDDYFVGRKTDLKYYIHSAEAMTEFSNRFGAVIQDSLMKGLSLMAAPDHKTEVALNSYCKVRWKNKLEILQQEFKEKEAVKFYDSVLELADQNKSNPSVENIFFESFKFISNHDPSIALNLFARSVYSDLHSRKFDNRKLSKAFQKILFKSAEQSAEFERIINELITSKNLEKAIESIPAIYQTKRKKIQLDTNKIKEVQLQDSDTVELLNEYLQDDPELDAMTFNQTEPTTSTAIDLHDTSSLFNNEISLTSSQKETIHFFAKNGYSIPITELDNFARSNGALKNALIGGINEACFECLDDVLIEEDDGSFTMNENYYHKILPND